MSPRNGRNANGVTAMIDPRVLITFTMQVPAPLFVANVSSRPTPTDDSATPGTIPAWTPYALRLRSPLEGGGIVRRVIEDSELSPSDRWLLSCLLSGIQSGIDFANNPPTPENTMPAETLPAPPVNCDNCALCRDGGCFCADEENHTRELAIYRGEIQPPSPADERASLRAALQGEDDDSDGFELPEYQGDDD